MIIPRREFLPPTSTQPQKLWSDTSHHVKKDLDNIEAIPLFDYT